MMLACDWRAVAPDLPADLVKGALSLSGVFELEPLRHAPFLAARPAARRRGGARASARRRCRRRAAAVALVGGDESEEFLRQNAAHRRGVGAGARCRSARRCPGGIT